MLIEQFFDAGLGHASYLVADPDEGVAFLVDPDRHLDPYLDAASKLGVLISHSFETHVHNDYVSGSPALAALRPISVVTGAGAALTYPHVGLADGETIAVGALRVKAVATPGHTPEHVAFLGPELEERLAHDAYDTLRDKVLSLADYVAVFPTHGGGSACTSSSVAGSRWTTLGFERRHNEVARAAMKDFAHFRAAIGKGLPVAPRYYPAVRKLNGRGASAEPRASLAVLRDPLPADAVLVDPRAPHVFATGHRRGALNVVGNDSFAVRLGAVVPFGASIVLLTPDRDRAEAL